jgi:hypothetical protein
MEHLQAEHVFILKHHFDCQIKEDQMSTAYNLHVEITHTYKIVGGKPEGRTLINKTNYL